MLKSNKKQYLGQHTVSEIDGLYEISCDRYNIYPDFLNEDFRYISNNDAGMKRLLFDLDGAENVVIDGCGAELMMHGRLIPFYLRRAKNVTLRNFFN